MNRKKKLQYRLVLLSVASGPMETLSVNAGDNCYLFNFITHQFQIISVGHEPWKGKNATSF